MKNLFLIISILLLTISCGNNVDPNIEEWQSLFNGEDLNGWDIKINGYDLNDNFGETFYVEDGMMKTKYDAYDEYNGRFGHIFYKEKFSHYKLKLEYRFTGEQANGGPGWAIRNSGAMLHSQSAQSMGKDQNFPISIEAQLLGGNGTDERPTVNLCTPGTNVYMADTLFTPHCISSTSKTYHGDQWVSVTFLVLGDSLIQHFVEGEEVLQYTKPQYGGGNVYGHDENLMTDRQPISEGYISLQSESHPVEFRKVKLLNLCGCKDEKASNYKSYFEKADKSVCIY